MNRSYPVNSATVSRVVAVMCLLFIAASAAAEIERPDLGQMKEARQQAAHRQRRIIYNDDADALGPYKTPEELISLRVKHVANTQVDSIYYCTGAGGLFWAHQPKVGEPARRKFSKGPEITG